MAQARTDRPTGARVWHRVAYLQVLWGLIFARKVQCLETSVIEKMEITKS